MIQHPEKNRIILLILKYKYMGEDTKTPAVELVMDRDTLVTHRNNFQKSLLGNLLDLRHHENIKKNDPDFKRMVKDRGAVGVDELIEDYKQGLEAARDYVEIIDNLLAMEVVGNLKDAWTEKTEAKVVAGEVTEAKPEATEEAPQEEKAEEVQGEVAEPTPAE